MILLGPGSAVVVYRRADSDGSGVLERLADLGIRDVWPLSGFVDDLADRVARGEPLHLLQRERGEGGVGFGTGERFSEFLPSLAAETSRRSAPAPIGLRSATRRPPSPLASTVSRASGSGRRPASSWSAMVVIMADPGTSSVQASPSIAMRLLPSCRPGDGLRDGARVSRPGAARHPRGRRGRHGRRLRNTVHRPPHDHCRGRGHSRCRLSKMTGVSAWPAAPADSRMGG